MQATQIVEALLFASDAPLAAGDLARGDEELDVVAVEEAIEQLRQAYEREGRAFQIYEIAGGYQILTRPELAPYLERFETVSQPSRLSGPALEVLAIVAYRQPIGRAEVEHIRGVGSAAVLRTLQERDLVEVVGRAEGLGRPLLYGTTARFLDHFGFRSLEDLPRPEDLPVVLHDREATGQSLEGGGEAAGQTMDAEGETGGLGERPGEDGLAGDEDRPGGAGLERGESASAGETADETEPADTRSLSPRHPVSPSAGVEGGGEEGVDGAAATRPDILDDVSDDPDEE